MTIDQKLKKAPKVFVIVNGRDDSFHIQISKKEANRLFDTAKANQFKVVVIDSGGTVVIERATDGHVVVDR